MFSTKYYRNEFGVEALDILRLFLLDVKHQQRSFSYKDPTYLGVLTDDNTLLVKDFLSIPAVHNSWDVLFLEYSLQNGTVSTVVNTAVSSWKPVCISDTRHFLINPYSIDTILDCIKRSRDWSEFVGLINKRRSFGITKRMFSERLSGSLLTASTVSKRSEIIEKYYSGRQVLDYARCVNSFKNVKQNMTPTKLYTLYPHISIVCCLTDYKKFLHTIYTFVSLDYPTDKIELLVVDDTDSEKRLRGKLPNDPRIRFVNLKPKGEQNVSITNKALSFPIANKLNLAVEYCKYDVIFHLFDTNVYFKQNFKSLVECYILSKQDCLVSIDTITRTNGCRSTSSVTSSSTSTSFREHIPDLANMIYTKRFANSFPFGSGETDHNATIHNFIKFRCDTVAYLPSIVWSYKTADKMSKSDPKPTILNFDLQSLLDPRDKQSVLLEEQME